MGSQILAAFLLLGLAVSMVENSKSDSDSDSSEYESSISEFTRSPSPAVSANYYHSPRDPVIQASPVHCDRSGSAEHLNALNQKRRYYDPQIFLPLGMDNIPIGPSAGNSPTPSEFGYVALENALKPDIEDIDLASNDQNLVFKSVASLLIAIILLLFYNGLCLHILP